MIEEKMKEGENQGNTQGMIEEKMNEGEKQGNT